MKIGINLLYLLPDQVGGTETYAAGLLSGLSQVAARDEITVFVNRESADWTAPESAGFRKVVCPVQASNRMNRYWYEQRSLPALLRDHRIDLVHSLGYVAPLNPGCASVVTIHDLNFRACGRQMPWTRRLSLAAFVRRSAWRSQRVIAVSEFSRQEILSVFGLPPEKVTTIHEAALAPTSPVASKASKLNSLGIRDPYILAFGNPLPHKNILRLIEAFGLSLKLRRTTHQLVVVGRAPAGDSWQSAARDTGLHERIVFTGHLDAATLADVMSGAQALAFPSLYEGFGLPILEAMAAGVPVACSERGAMQEIAGKAALLFDPLSVQQMAGALGELATIPALRQYLIDKGHENVRRFNWRQAAAQTMAVYCDVLKRKQVSPVGPLQKAA